MLLTKGSGFQGLDSTRNEKDKYGAKASRALLVDDDHLIGDVPRLIVNQEESSFLSAAN